MQGSQKKKHRNYPQLLFGIFERRDMRKSSPKAINPCPVKTISGSKGYICQQLLLPGTIVGVLPLGGFLNTLATINDKGNPLKRGLRRLYQEVRPSRYMIDCGPRTSLERSLTCHCSKRETRSGLIKKGTIGQLNRYQSDLVSRGLDSQFRYYVNGSQ